MNANEMLVITMHNDLADGVDVVFEVFARAHDQVLADLLFLSIDSYVSWNGNGCV